MDFVNDITADIVRTNYIVSNNANKSVAAQGLEFNTAQTEIISAPTVGIKFDDKLNRVMLSNNLNDPSGNVYWYQIATHKDIPKLHDSIYTYIYNYYFVNRYRYSYYYKYEYDYEYKYEYKYSYSYNYGYAYDYSYNYDYSYDYNYEYEYKYYSTVIKYVYHNYEYGYAYWYNQFTTETEERPIINLLYAKDLVSQIDIPVYSKLANIIENPVESPTTIVNGYTTVSIDVPELRYNVSAEYFTANNPNAAKLQKITGSPIKLITVKKQFNGNTSTEYVNLNDAIAPYLTINAEAEVTRDFYFYVIAYGYNDTTTNGSAFTLLENNVEPNTVYTAEPCIVEGEITAFNIEQNLSTAIDNISNQEEFNNLANSYISTNVIPAPEIEKLVVKSVEQNTNTIITEIKADVEIPTPVTYSIEYTEEETIVNAVSWPYFIEQAYTEYYTDNGDTPEIIKNYLTETFIKPVYGDEFDPYTGNLIEIGTEIETIPVVQYKNNTQAYINNSGDMETFISKVIGVYATEEDKS